MKTSDLKVLTEKEIDAVSGGALSNVTNGNGNEVPGGGAGLVTQNSGGNQPPGQNKGPPFGP